MIVLLNFIRRYWISTTLFILTVITVLSLRPLSQLPAVPGSDKIHHFIAYGVLMLPTALRKPKYWLMIGVFFVCWSGVIELLQPYVNRYCEFKDLAANVIGLISGLLVARLIKWLLPNNLDSK